MMSGVLYSSTLPLENTAEAGYLEQMLNHFATSYKIYFFQGILEEVLAGRKRISMRRASAQMIASAWYPVIYYHLNLGSMDMLADVIAYLSKQLKVNREIRKTDLLKFLESCRDETLEKKQNALLNYVPARLIRPFYEDRLRSYREEHGILKDSQVDVLIQQYVVSDPGAALYQIDPERKFLTVSDHWYEYLRSNGAVIQGWVSYKLIQYLQKRNPSVPAISSKIFPPEPHDRSLVAARKLWDLVQIEHPIHDLYTGRKFDEADLREYGGISIDHFIPWSFVLHNEIWDLCPSFKRVNSSKLDRLPDRKEYLDHFCDLQYRAFQTVCRHRDLRNMAEEYMTLKPDILLLNESETGREEFCRALRNTIDPLYQIALNQGYGIWKCDRAWISRPESSDH